MDENVDNNGISSGGNSGSSSTTPSVLSSKSYTCPSLLCRLTKSKGAVGISLAIPDVGTMLFINAHLPFNSRSLKKDADRTSALQWQATCFKYLYTIAVEDFKPDYCFFMGDLNFRLVGDFTPSKLLEDLANGDLKEYLDREELNVIKTHASGKKCEAGGNGSSGSSSNSSGNIPYMKEGVNDVGPNFLPTAKMRKNRSCGSLLEENYKLGIEQRRLPSWTDRILYNECMRDNNNKEESLTCIDYNSFDVGNMNQSDHSAVYSTFLLKLGG
jgi:hypothetical protein